VADHCAAQDLIVNPKEASPYLLRTSETAVIAGDTSADWISKQSYKKAALITSDYGGGLENGDSFASAFIKRGGSIVQELHPPLGTNDFGPFLTQLSTSADVLVVFTPGADGLRFINQYGTYVSNSKLRVFDLLGTLSAGSTLAQAKDKAAGVYGQEVYVDSIDTPENQAFVKAWQSKYPGRAMPSSAGNAYSGAQIIVNALTQVGGAVENKQRFLQALSQTNVTTVKGPFKFDQNHDPTENSYIYQIVKTGSGANVSRKMLQTYTGVSNYWDRTANELKTFPFGKMKGKWVGMTADQLAKMTS